MIDAHRCRRDDEPEEAFVLVEAGPQDRWTALIFCDGDVVDVPAVATQGRTVTQPPAELDLFSRGLGWQIDLRPQPPARIPRPAESSRQGIGGD